MHVLNFKKICPTEHLKFCDVFFHKLVVIFFQKYNKKGFFKIATRKEVFSKVRNLFYVVNSMKTFGTLFFPKTIFYVAKNMSMKSFLDSVFSKNLCFFPKTHCFFLRSKLQHLFKNLATFHRWTNLFCPAFFIKFKILSQATRTFIFFLYIYLVH